MFYTCLICFTSRDNYCKIIWFTLNWKCLLFFFHQIQWDEENPIRWIDGHIPTDSLQDRSEYLPLSYTLYGVMSTLACLGIFLAVIFLIFNVAFRNIKLVKMSSPRLNNIILVGCMLCYASIFAQVHFQFMIHPVSFLDLGFVLDHAQFIYSNNVFYAIVSVFDLFPIPFSPFFRHASWISYKIYSIFSI